mmetsp:Transcript_62393/g.150064  ORF Transcript_62393/g.150064 Transcript_62393/m.150064 type:complete len:200 (-) Transcript_62393:763-1362(-)
MFNLLIHNHLKLLKRLLALPGPGAHRPDHLAHFKIVGVVPQHPLEAHLCLGPLLGVHQRLPEPDVGQQKVGLDRGRVLVKLLCLFKVAPDVKSSCDMVARLTPHARHRRTVKRLPCESIRLVELPSHQKVVCEEVEQHRVLDLAPPALHGVVRRLQVAQRLGHLPLLEGLSLVQRHVRIRVNVHLRHRKTYESVDVVRH